MLTCQRESDSFDILNTSSFMPSYVMNISKYSYLGNQQWKKPLTHSICSLLIDSINFAMNAIKFQTLLILLFRAWVHLPLDKISKIVLCQILHYVKVFLLYSTLLRFYYTSNAYTCRCYFLEETLEGLL